MWGYRGPYVVEIVFINGRRSFHIFEDQYRASAFRRQFLHRQDIQAVYAWDMTGGWQQ